MATAPWTPCRSVAAEDRHTAVQGESQAGGKAEEQTQELQQKWLRNAQLDSEIAHRDALLEERDRGIREVCRMHMCAIVVCYSTAVSPRR